MVTKVPRSDGGPVALGCRDVGARAAGGHVHARGATSDRLGSPPKVDSESRTPNFEFGPTRNAERPGRSPGRLHCGVCSIANCDHNIFVIAIANCVRPTVLEYNPNVPTCGHLMCAPHQLSFPPFTASLPTLARAGDPARGEDAVRPPPLGRRSKGVA